MKRVLLTGGTGFIGRHCVPLLLARDYEVHVVYSKQPVDSCSRVYWHQVDLLDSDQTAALVDGVQPSHLLHLAWYAVPGLYWTSLENVRWVQASLGLLQSFAQSGGQRVVMAGTCAEYGRHHGCCSEHLTPLCPSTLYGTCKHALQILVEAFARQSGLSAAWGRVFLLYGPYEHPDRLVSSMIRSVLRGKRAHCSNGELIRDFLHVQDVAGAFTALLDSGVNGAVNIGSGQPVAIKDVVDRISGKAGRRDLIEFGVIPSDKGTSDSLVADIRRMSDEVGWSPTYDLDRGLEQTISWWRGRLVKECEESVA